MNYFGNIVFIYIYIFFFFCTELLNLEMRGVYLSYTTSSSGQKKMVARLEDHVSLII